MKRTRKPGKRVVSKGQYALAQGIRVGQAVSGFVAILFGVFIGLSGIIGMALVILPILKDLVEAREVLMNLIAIFIFLVSGISVGVIAVELLRAGFTGIKEAAKSEVVPFTRANTGDFPAPDSLVRASSEPKQAQKSVLLRAATEGTRDEKTQMLRAATGKQE